MLVVKFWESFHKLVAHVFFNFINTIKVATNLVLIKGWHNIWGHFWGFSIKETQRGKLKCERFLNLLLIICSFLNFPLFASILILRFILCTNLVNQSLNQSFLIYVMESHFKNAVFRWFDIKCAVFVLCTIEIKCCQNKLWFNSSTTLECLKSMHRFKTIELFLFFCNKISVQVSA
jgi:hypothetical protein